jgi:hypothetical protein
MAKNKGRKKQDDGVRRVTRKIYFYRVNIGVGEDGKPLHFDPTPALTHIGGLAYDPDGNYLVTPEGAETLCIIERNIQPHRIMLANVRRTGLPQQEEAGILAPLGIPATSGIVEPIHVVFFKDNIVGCEFNFYGPRVARLKAYLVAKGGGYCSTIEFSALLRQNAVDDLGRMKSLKSLTLRIHGSYAETLEKADQSLGAAFKAARDVGEAGLVTIVLSPEKRSKAAKIADGVSDMVKRVMKLPDIREQAKDFKVTGIDEESGKQLEIDLLSDQFIAKKTVLQTDSRTRAVDSTSAFRAIEEAYTELYDELIKAPGISG